MEANQGADVGGRSLYLDYVGQKSSFKSGARGGRQSFGGGGDREKSTAGKNINI